MKVRFTRPAQCDLDQIHTHILVKTVQRSRRFVARIIERAKTLADHPFEGMQTDEPDTRVIMASRLRYFIFCTIASDEIHITHIRHMSRRRPKSWNR